MDDKARVLDQDRLPDRRDRTSAVLAQRPETRQERQWQTSFDMG